MCKSHIVSFSTGHNPPIDHMHRVYRRYIASVLVLLFRIRPEAIHTSAEVRPTRAINELSEDWSGNIYEIADNDRESKGH